MSNEILTNVRSLNIEPSLNSAVMMDYLHQMVHEERVYIVNNYSESVSNNSSRNLLVRPVDGRPLHIRFQGSCGGDALIELIENPTVENTGMVITAFNKNRKGDVTSDVQTFSGATITPGLGLTLVQAFLPGGRGGQSVGGVLTSFAEEFVLKDETYYLLTITNKSGQSKPVQLDLVFYSEYAR